MTAKEVATGSREDPQGPDRCTAVGALPCPAPSAPPGAARVGRMGAWRKQEERSVVEVDGRRLSLSNLGKVLYPETGFTKGEVVDYYVRIAPVLLPHVADRPMSFQRFPDGVATKGFFAKNAPPGTPDWVRRVRLPAPGSTKSRETLDYVVVDSLPTLVWAANLAALELHVPQWTVGPRGAARAARPAGARPRPGRAGERRRVRRGGPAAQGPGRGRRARAAGQDEWLQGDAGQRGRPPGVRRAHVGLRPRARQAAREGAPDLVVSRMAKNLRGGKVFVDWSQNNAAKTTVAPYALRARPQPWVSTPVTWDEVAACRKPRRPAVPSPTRPSTASSSSATCGRRCWGRARRCPEACGPSLWTAAPAHRDPPYAAASRGRWGSGGRGSGDGPVRRRRGSTTRPGAWPGGSRRRGRWSRRRPGPRAGWPTSHLALAATALADLAGDTAELVALDLALLVRRLRAGAAAAGVGRARPGPPGPVA